MFVSKEKPTLISACPNFCKSLDLESQYPCLVTMVTTYLVWFRVKCLRRGFCSLRANDMPGAGNEVQFSLPFMPQLIRSELLVSYELHKLLTQWLVLK